MITPLGGALNLVFQLSPVQQEDSAKLADGTAGGVLGKLDIKWRTTFGDVGRLQTQPISAPAAALKDVKLQVDCAGTLRQKSWGVQKEIIANGKHHLQAKSKQTHAF